MRKFDDADGLRDARRIVARHDRRESLQLLRRARLDDRRVPSLHVASRVLHLRVPAVVWMRKIVPAPMPDDRHRGSGRGIASSVRA